MRKSLFIAIDGIDGSGSTTHSHLLKTFLESQNFKVHLTQEPSDGEIGILLRKFLKNKDIPPATDALMFAADRVIHYHNEIKKKLDDGFIVVSDRYKESSVVYQSLQSDQITIEWIKDINKFAGEPDLTIILDIDAKISLTRKKNDNLEKFENKQFLEKVRALYLSRAEKLGYNIINSDDKIELVQEKIQRIIMDKLKELKINS